MACYHPLKAYRPLSKIDGGRLVFDSKLALNPDHHIVLPCQRCIGCRLDKSGDWAMRCIHEAQMYSRNCFITLTYNNEHLPADYSVSVRDTQLFFKRLRKKYGPNIRFYLGAEYGELNLRPHYHIILFNHDFDDKVYVRTNEHGDRIYTSISLEKLWGKSDPGRCELGDVTYQSAGYCAQYTMKKVSGDRASTHYLRTHPLSGLVVKVEPEFSTQSRNPGLGDAWFEKYKGDCFPSDFLVVDGRQHRVPTYYLRKLEKLADAARVEPPRGKYLTTLAKEEPTQIKRARTRNSLPRRDNATPARLAVREEVKHARLKRLKRDL